MPIAFAGEDAVITQGETTSAGENAHAVQEAAPLEGEVTETRTSSIFDNWLLWIVIAMWVWFLFGNKKRKAQRAQEKKEKERRESLQRGDKIVTIGRMHCTVVAFTEKTVTVRPDNKSEYAMTFDREAILRVLPRPGEEDGAAAADSTAPEADAKQ